uniref:Phosphoinositide-3-kinase regulatory subunit 6 n=1 Tax=Latimeria chalumnae TaxID=7897 RepID=H2ZRQ1_LATCH
MEPSAPPAAMTAEAIVRRNIHGFLRDLDDPNTPPSLNHGVLRWTLHKKIEQDLNYGRIAIKILVEELEKAVIEGFSLGIHSPWNKQDQWQHFKKIIFFFTCIKGTIYIFCISIPRLAYIKAVVKGQQTESHTHLRQRTSETLHSCYCHLFGSLLYQRMVLSEQSRIFVFADPELISEDVIAAVCSEFESTSTCKSLALCMINVITHSMLAALGERCDIRSLDTVLKEKTIDVVEQYFLDVVVAAEVKAKELIVDRKQYIKRLERIYSTILSSSLQGKLPCWSTYSLIFERPVDNVALPSPNISFHLWKEDDQLCK